MFKSLIRNGKEVPTKQKEQLVTEPVNKTTTTAIQGAFLSCSHCIFIGRHHTTNDAVCDLHQQNILDFRRGYLQAKSCTDYTE